MLNPAVAPQLVNDLLYELVDLGGPCLYEVFATERQRLRQADRWARASGCFYERFVERERSSGLSVLLYEYPVLMRLVSQRIDEHVAAAERLVRWLGQDGWALATTFGGGRPLGRVGELRFGLSDRHRGGQTVARVRFESGLELACKPKPLAAEAAWSRLLDEVARWGAEGPRAAIVVARDDHGWAEWLGDAPCTSREGVRRFYRRAGCLLVLAWVLGGTDLLTENLVAVGEHPAVVDGEMMAVPQLADSFGRGSPFGEGMRGADDDAHWLADAMVVEALEGSVADTGLLPRWLAAGASGSQDVSGLTGRRRRQAVPWQFVNTSFMLRSAEPAIDLVGENWPRLDGLPVEPACFVEDLVSGSRQAARLLARRADDLVSLVPATGLWDAPARFAFRATLFYLLLLRRSCEPRLLRNGIERSLVLDAVNNRSWWSPKLAGVYREEPQAARAVTAAERAALERLDVPLFVSRPSTHQLPVSGQSWAIFEGRPEKALRERLDHMDKPWAAEMELVVRGSFEARGVPAHALPGRFGGAGHRTEQAPDQSGAGRSTASNDASLPASLEAAARRAADLIERQAYRCEGTVSWLVVGENHAIRRHQLLPIGPDLYGGRAGVGAFLAAAAVADHDERLADLALRCVRPIVPTRLASATDLGGALTGLASSLYGAAVVAHLLDDAALRRQVISASAFLSSDASPMAAEWAPAHGLRSGTPLGPWDVASGPLGAALALAGVARLLDSHAMAARATELLSGASIHQHLLARGVGGRGAWAEVAGADAGLAHGLLGASLAWHRLAEVLDPPWTAEPIEVCMAAAATYLGQKSPSGDVRWCHGAAGVGLSILALGPRSSSPAWRKRLEDAMDACRRVIEKAETGASPLDASACCGLGGAVELLTAAGRQDEARRAAALLIAPEGDDWPLGNRFGAAALLLGFHRGVAGLGYTLLRAAGRSLPSILTWSCL